MPSKEIKVQGLTLFVTDEHIYHKGEFILHCKELNLSERTLKEATCVDEAIKGAFEFIENYLLLKLKALDDLKNKVGDLV